MRILGWPEGVIDDADSRSDGVIGVHRGESLLVINYRNERGDSVKKAWAQL